MVGLENNNNEEVIKDDAYESAGLEKNQLSDSSGIEDCIKRAGKIAESAYRKGIMQQESCDFFKGLSSSPSISEALEGMCNSPFAPPGGKLGMAKSILKQAEGQYDKGASILALIDEAIKGEYVSDSDREFYLEKIIQDPKFVGKFSESERYIKEKLEEAKKYKEEYGLLLVNPLIKNGNELQIAKSSGVKIMDEKKFLKMKPKEKKEYLKECDEHLEKAEKYAEELEKNESDEIDKEYAGKLEHFQKEDKIIGIHTVKRFKKWMDTVEGVDAKREALSGLHKEEGGQLNLHDNLWSNIRANLKGEELVEMEKYRNDEEVGYTKLSVKYGKMGDELNDKYKEELDKCVKSGDISDEVAKKFMNDSDGMKNQTNLQAKYHYISELPVEIEKYKKSHKENDELPEEKSNSAIDMSDPLDAVTNLTAKRGIQQAIEGVKKEGSEQVSGLLRIVKSVTRGGQQSDNYDASGFQSSLRQKRGEKVKKEEVTKKETTDSGAIDFQQVLREKRNGKKVNKKRSWNPFSKKAQPEIIDTPLGSTDVPLDTTNQTGEVTAYNIKFENINKEPEKVANIASKRTSKEIDKSDIKEEIDELKEVSSTNIIDDMGFLEVQMEDERNTIADITRSEARSRLLFENQRKQYKSKQDGGKDRTTFAVKTEGSQVIELDLTQVRAMEKALEREKAY